MSKRVVVAAAGLAGLVLVARNQTARAKVGSVADRARNLVGRR